MELERCVNKMEIETELKYCPVDKDEVRKVLERMGFEMQASEMLMKRVTMHNAQLPDRWGRVRVEAKGVTMTIKRVVDPTVIDGTEEAEVIVPDFQTGIGFLAASGFKKTSYQENYREVWHGNEVDVTLDTWPGLPTLVEIEGNKADAVFNASDLLGFDQEQAMYGSIDLVYEKVVGILSSKIIELKEITFDKPPT